MSFRRINQLTAVTLYVHYRPTDDGARQSAACQTCRSSGLGLSTQ